MGRLSPSRTVIGNSNRFESQLRSTPAGNIIFTVWNEANNDAGLGGAYSGLSTSTSDDGTGVTPPPADDPVVQRANNDTSEDILGGFDNLSLFAMIFGFVAIGAFIARRKLSATK